MKTSDRLLIAGVLGLPMLIFLSWLGFWGFIIYSIFHFIFKFW